MTTRQFNFTGSTNAVDSTGTITINGIEVYNGIFTGEGISGEVIASGSVDVDNALASNDEISVPTTITLSSGMIYVALTKWNYAPIPNPVYSEEQLALLNDTSTTREVRVAIYKTVAVPPLSPEDEAMLLTTDPADAAVRQAVLVSHNLTTRIQDPAQFNFGINPDECFCNRTNVLLNGVEPPNANTNVGILMTAGDTLTYNSIVFSSNFTMTMT